MKTIDLLMLQGAKSMPQISLYGVYRGNSGTSDDGGAYINATFEGEAYIKDLTTQDKTYLTSGENVAWDVPMSEARNYIIVGKISALTVQLNYSGPQYCDIQEIRMNNVRCTDLTYKAFNSSAYAVVPTITGNKYVKNMNLTIFGAGAGTSSVYEIGTFLMTLDKCNSSGALKMESGFVTSTNIGMASSKYYTLSPLS